jgi:pimeloyl-ACP methyl ester carboxylesterase
MRVAAGAHELEVEIIGEGRPLLFVHGLAVDRRVMTASFEPLADGWRRIYVDLPGHGASRGDPAHASADELVDALEHLVRELCGSDTPPAVIGYAYGGYLALGLAARVALDGLFLVCPTVEADFGKRRVPARRVTAREELVFSDDPREKEAFEEVAVVQTNEALETFRRVVHPANIAADQGFMAATRGRYVMSRPYMHLLQTFEKPVGIVCGRDDHWVGYEDAVSLVKTFAEAHFTVVPRAGNLLPFEAPAILRAQFESWLARL